MKAGAVKFALLALWVGVTGCGVFDPLKPLEPVEDPEPQEPVEEFRLNAVSTPQSDWFESFEGRIGCFTNTLMHGGRLELQAEKFTLSFWHTVHFPSPPEFKPDTTVITGRQRSQGSMIVLTTSDGGALFAAAGPSPDERTTVVLSDPSRALRGCKAYRFVMPGTLPEDQTSDGGSLDLSFSVEEVYYRGWTRLPVTYTVNSIVGEIWINRGTLKLGNSGDYFASLDYTRYRQGLLMEAGTATAEGSYIVSHIVGGTLIMFDPMKPRQTVTPVGAGGVMQFSHQFKFTPGSVTLPGSVRMRLE